MSEKTQIVLLGISMIILIIINFNMYEQIQRLERNQEVLRKAFNKLSKEKTNDSRNTNEVT